MDKQYILKNTNGKGDMHIFRGPPDMTVSDGYNTMDELYDHRIRLWITLCRAISEYNCDYCLEEFGEKVNHNVWKSLLRSDGWFILGHGKAAGHQMTYHIPEKYWDECDFAETLERAPEYDGHTSEDVLDRITNLL